MPSPPPPMPSPPPPSPPQPPSPPPMPPSPPGGPPPPPSPPGSCCKYTGCGHASALNYDPKYDPVASGRDDAKCIWPMTIVGCTDPRAANYRSDATTCYPHNPLPPFPPPAPPPSPPPPSMPPAPPPPPPSPPPPGAPPSPP